MKISFFYILISTLFFSCKSKNDESIEKTKIELGNKLFFDQRLSYNLTKSCSSCHDPKFAFTDGYKKSIGIYGDVHQRNSKPLFNLANQQFYTAADSTIHTLEQQMNKPLFNEHPPEMGLFKNENEIIERLEKDKFYPKLFKEAFGNKHTKISFIQIKESISAFIKTIQSYNSKYDAYLDNKKNILTANEEAGRVLFFSDSLSCNNCHGGKNFNEPNIVDEINNRIFYFNTGLYNLDGKGGYPSNDIGLMQFTKQSNDMGKYKVPTLRNLAYTAPYYHDGSAQSLIEVIEDYNKGGRIIKQGLNKGNGITNPFKHNSIKALNLTIEEKKQLLSFLYTLNDSSLLHNTNYLPTITSNK
jgi:cytochrome c peroxidase